MRLRRLQLTCFRQLRRLDIAFQDGLILVTGESGSGKSALLEGILWALYGGEGVRAGEGSLRSDGAAAGAVTSAALDFEHDGRTWRVTRRIDEDGTGAALQRGDELLCSDAASVRSAITAMLGSMESFMHAAVTGRRELQQLVQLHPAERLRTLSRLLGAPEGATTPLRDAMLTLQREIAESDERIRTLQGGTDLLAQYGPELERARADLAVAEQEAERLHDEWAQKRQDVETRLAAYHRRADELSRQIERLSQAGASGACPTCEQPLGSGVDMVLSRLDDEVYTAAQDSKWLMQRQSQLSHKPPDLVAAETQRARLRDVVQDRTARVARCEQAMQELWTVATDRKRALAYLDALRDAGSARTTPAPPDAAMLDRLETHAGGIVAHVSGGRFDGVVLQDDGRVHARAGGRALAVIASADEELVALALRLAVMRVLRDARRAELLVLDEPFANMSAQRRSALLELLQAEGVAQLLVCTSQRVDSQRTDVLFSVRTGPEMPFQHIDF